MTSRKGTLCVALPWVLLLAAAGLSVLAGPPPSAVARLFFVVALGGALVAGLHAIGGITPGLGAGLLLTLTLGQVLVDRPVAAPPSSQWTVALRGPVERIRHLVSPPLGTVAWHAWWSRAAGAAVYVCARGPLEERDALDLFAGGQLLARITQAHAVGPRPQPTSVGFYRVPIERSRIEAVVPLELELRRGDGGSERPIDICGTFTHRPTAGIDSSAFYDGQNWSSPGPTRRGRYIIELRLEEAPGRTIAALY